MARLKVGDKVIGPNSGSVYEILAVHEGFEVQYWTIQQGHSQGDHHVTAQTRGPEVETWKTFTGFFEKGEYYKSDRGTIAHIKYVEELNGEKYAFAVAVTDDGVSTVITLPEWRFDFWEKQ